MTGIAPEGILRRSYGRVRARKLRPEPQRRMDVLLPRFELTLPASGSLSLPELFGETKRRYALEIGFGGGEHLAVQAARNKETGFLGCEPFQNGVAMLLGRIEENSIGNIRIFMQDVRLLLPRVPDASLSEVFILFPDPWPKERHQARRLVQPALLESIARVLMPGGKLLLATDDASYGAWMLHCLLAHKDFIWDARRPQDFEEAPEGWVVTRYQEKAKKAGRAPLFLRWRRK